MTAEFFQPASYSFSFYALPNLVAALTMFTLGLVVLVTERCSRVAVSFFVMITTATVWLSGYGIMYCAVTAGAAAAWAAIGHLGITFIPAAVYHFTVRTLQTERHGRRRVHLSWLTCGAFCAGMLGTGAFIGAVHRYWWGYYPVYNWLGILFVAYFFALMVLSLEQYWTSYHTAARQSTRARSKAMFLAFCAAYLASFDYLPALGVASYPFGHIAVLGFVVLVAHAIRRHRLVDITPAFAARQITDAMDDALLVFDNEGMVRVANGAASRMFRRGEKDLEGTPIETLEESFHRPEEGMADAILTGSLREIEYTLNTESPVPQTVSLSSYSMRDDNDFRVATVCIIRDVTQRKRAQQEIQRHTERQTALYEIHRAVTSTLELQAVLRVLLDRLTRLVPQSTVTIMLLEPGDGTLVRVAVDGAGDEIGKNNVEAISLRMPRAVIEKREAVVVSDLRAADLLAEDDAAEAFGFVSYLGVPLLAKERTLGVLSFYCRKAHRFSDEEVNFIKSLAGQAAAAIDNSQLYEQTRRQAVDLDKANRVKTEFLSVMSHELRTPLNVIAGYTRLVQDGVLGGVNAEQRRALEKVIHHSNELLMMVNSIMDATKIEADAVTVEREEFSLARFFEDLRLSYDYPLAKDVALRWDIPDDLPSMDSDRDKLKHILQNLINNALKFTEHGYIMIRARYLAPTDTLAVAVEDTGVGITAEDVPLIFERFRQLDGSHTRSFGGVGLGLHIVRSFVELIEGSVSVVSAPGRGSTFTINAPCRLSPPAINDPQSSPRRPPPARPQD